MESELQKGIVRNETVAGLYEKVYEDNAAGKVTDEWFMQLSHKYEVERSELKMKIADLRKRLQEADTKQAGRNNFIAAIRRFMEMKRLTRPLLHELNDRIERCFTSAVQGFEVKKHSEDLSQSAEWSVRRKNLTVGTVPVSG